MFHLSRVRVFFPEMCPSQKGFPNLMYILFPTWLAEPPCEASEMCIDIASVVCVSVSQAALLEGVELCPKDRKIDQCRQKMWRRERCLLCMQSVPKSCDSRMESDIQKVML